MSEDDRNQKTYQDESVNKHMQKQEREMNSEEVVEEISINTDITAENEPNNTISTNSNETTTCQHIVKKMKLQNATKLIHEDFNKQNKEVQNNVEEDLKRKELSNNEENNITTVECSAVQEELQSFNTSESTNELCSTASNSGTLEIAFHEVTNENENTERTYNDAITIPITVMMHIEPITIEVSSAQETRPNITRRRRRSASQRRPRRRRRVVPVENPPAIEPAVVEGEGEVEEVEYHMITSETLECKKTRSWRTVPRYDRLSASETAKQEADLYYSFVEETNPEEVKVAGPEDRQCCICYENVATRIIIPCGHLCLCYVCAKSVAFNRTTLPSSSTTVTKRCPLCLAVISKIIRPL